MKFCITLPLSLLLLASTALIPGFSLDRRALGANVAWVAAPSDDSQDADLEEDPYGQYGYDYDDAEHFGVWQEENATNVDGSNWRAACLAQYMLDYLNDPINATISIAAEEGTDDATEDLFDGYTEEDYRLIHGEVAQAAAGEFDQGALIDHESWIPENPRGEAVRYEEDAWWSNTSNLPTEETSTWNLFAWLPEELLDESDQKMLCQLQELSDASADTRHDWFRDCVEVLGEQAAAMGRRIDLRHEDAFVELADDPCSAAVFLATYRLVDQGELQPEAAVEVLEQSLESMPDVWVEGVYDVIDSVPVDEMNDQDGEESPRETTENQAAENSTVSPLWGEGGGVLQKLQYVAGVAARLVNRLEGMK